MKKTELTLRDQEKSWQLETLYLKMTDQIQEVDNGRPDIERANIEDLTVIKVHVC